MVANRARSPGEEKEFISPMLMEGETDEHVIFDREKRRLSIIGTIIFAVMICVVVCSAVSLLAAFGVFQLPFFGWLAWMSSVGQMSQGTFEMLLSSFQDMLKENLTVIFEFFQDIMKYLLLPLGLFVGYWAGSKNDKE